MALPATPTAHTRGTRVRVTAWTVSGGRGMKLGPDEFALSECSVGFSMCPGPRCPAKAAASWNDSQVQRCPGRISLKEAARPGEEGRVSLLSPA